MDGYRALAIDRKYKCAASRLRGDDFCRKLAQRYLVYSGSLGPLRGEGPEAPVEVGVGPWHGPRFPAATAGQHQRTHEAAAGLGNAIERLPKGPQFIVR